MLRQPDFRRLDALDPREDQIPNAVAETLPTGLELCLRPLGDGIAHYRTETIIEIFSLGSPESTSTICSA